MKRDILNLPFFLLLAFVFYCGGFKQPEIADGLFAIALSALYGFKLFLNHKTPKVPQEPTDLRSQREELQKLKFEEETMKVRLNIKRLGGQIASSEGAPIEVKF